jgi:gluconokinase
LRNQLILALDIGTSSVRAALYDGAGEPIPDSLVKNERRLTTTADGGSEIDAWSALAQVEDAIDDVLAKTSGPIETVAVSAFWHSLLGIDANGEPTTPVFAWAENRPARFVRELRARLDEATVHNRTGAHFHASFWPAKLLWLKADRPEAFVRTSRWISFSDFVLLNFTGQLQTSVSMASATGIFDQRLCDWDAGLIECLGLRRPDIAADGDELALSPRLAENWPQLAKAKWLPAIGDGAANNLGAQCDSPDRAALMIGTSGAMRVAFTGEVPDQIPEGLWCYRTDRRRIVLGGALSDGGGLYRWLKDTLGLTGTDDEIEGSIAAREPDSHGLVFLPFLFGERSTGYHGDARGAIVGLRSTTDAIDIARAALESVAYRFAEIFQRIETVGDVREVVASGGALRESPVWTEIIADVLGRDLFLPDTREASSRGAARYALEIAGAKIRVRADAGTVFRHDPARTAKYIEARHRHREIYDVLVADR